MGLCLLCVAFAANIPADFKLELRTLQTEAIKKELRQIDEAVAGMPNVTDILIELIIQKARNAAKSKKDRFILVLSEYPANLIGDWARVISYKYHTNTRVMERMKNMYKLAVDETIQKWNYKSDLYVTYWDIGLSYTTVFCGRWDMPAGPCDAKNPDLQKEIDFELTQI